MKTKKIAKTMKKAITMKTKETMETKKLNLNEQGITLVALVVTIIILLILAGVTINIALRENGLFKMARTGANKYEQSATNEQNTLEEVEREIKILTKAPVDKTSHVGWYASKDGITVDGIIYADQAVGNTNGTQWIDDNGVYTIPIKEEGLKEYYISQETYTTKAFGSKPVLTPINDEGEDRFYIMSLENFGGHQYYWYYSAWGSMDDYKTATSTAFGAGKTNTENMVAKWKAGKDGGYGSQDGGSDYKDIWGYFARGEIPEGWFLPSRGELAAFMQELSIKYGQVATRLCSSSQYSAWDIWSSVVWVNSMNMNSTSVVYPCSVRLSATF